MTSPRAYLRGRIAQFVSFPRRKRRISTPRWLTVNSYAELLDASRPAMYWLHGPGALPPSTELLFPELASDEIRKHHLETQPHSSGIGVACLHSALVSGHSLVGTRSSLYLLAPITPLFVDQFLQDSDLVGDRRLSKKARRFVPGVSVLLTNWNSCTYGHWLLEGMPKLLLLSRMSDELPKFRIVLPQSLPTWIRTWVHLLLPNAAIDVYEDSAEYLECETLLMPTMLLSAEHFPHPQLAGLLDIAIRLSSAAHTNPCRRLFVSRIAPNPYRGIINEAEIEQIAVEEGLTVIKPEALSIPEQIAQFSQAQLIVGEFGSAMHNTLFSPAGARVFCLNWINPLQSYIARLKRHHVGYLLPSSGVPVTYVLGQPRIDYHVDPRVFRDCLRSLNAP